LVNIVDDSAPNKTQFETIENSTFLTSVPGTLTFIHYLDLYYDGIATPNLPID